MRRRPRMGRWHSAIAPSGLSQGLHFGINEGQLGRAVGVELLDHVVSNGVSAHNRTASGGYENQCALCCLAHEMEWSVLETELAELQTELQALGVCDIDAALAAQIRARLCEAEGRDEAARMAWKMVVQSLKHLGWEDEARVIEDKIGL